jgi:hypothetical protein
MWSYKNPEFTYRKDFNDLHLPWSGHCRFAYDLIANLQPRSVVELGTWKGTSLFSFAQAVIDLDLDCRLDAIDTWEGDKHTGAYDRIFEDVVAVKNKYYAGVDISLHRMLFDEAIHKFEDGSVDILHIDGLHTYEAVKHDFLSWLPKCSKDGVILFHDTAERMQDFGVHILWEELSKDYRCFEFAHSHGLGVLFLSDNPFAKEFGPSMLAHYYERAYEDVKSELRSSKRVEREYSDFKRSPFYRAIQVVRKAMGRV